MAPVAPATNTLMCLSRCDACPPAAMSSAELQDAIPDRAGDRGAAVVAQSQTHRYGDGSSFHSLASASMACPFPAGAQQTKVRHVGALLLGIADAESFRAELRQGLRKAGYVEGGNIGSNSDRLEAILLSSPNSRRSWSRSRSMSSCRPKPGSQVVMWPPLRCPAPSALGKELGLVGKHSSTPLLARKVAKEISPLAARAPGTFRNAGVASAPSVVSSQPKIRVLPSAPM